MQLQIFYQMIGLVCFRRAHIQHYSTVLPKEQAYISKPKIFTPQNGLSQHHWQQPIFCPSSSEGKIRAEVHTLFRGDSALLLCQIWRSQTVHRLPFLPRNITGDEIMCKSIGSIKISRAENKKALKFH